MNLRDEIESERVVRRFRAIDRTGTDSMTSNPNSRDPFRQYLYPSLHETFLTSIWTEDMCQQIEARFLEEDRKPSDVVPRQNDFRNNVTVAKLNDMASSPMKFLARDSKLFC